MSTVLAIDPGNTESAFVLLDGKELITSGKWGNESLIRQIQVGPGLLAATHCAIETMKPRGMPTSLEEMQTQFFAGRVYQAWYEWKGGEKFGWPPTQMFRHDVKIALCGRATAKDSNIRAALIDLYGGKDKAIGKKKTPGPLYGIKGDCWQALALGYVWQEKYANAIRPL